METVVILPMIYGDGDGCGDGDGDGGGDGDGDDMNVWMFALMVVLETRIESGNVMIINCSSLVIVVVGFCY